MTRATMRTVHVARPTDDVHLLSALGNGGSRFQLCCGHNLSNHDGNTHPNVSLPCFGEHTHTHTHTHTHEPCTQTSGAGRATCVVAGRAARMSQQGCTHIAPTAAARRGPVRLRVRTVTVAQTNVHCVPGGREMDQTSTQGRSRGQLLPSRSQPPAATSPQCNRPSPLSRQHWSEARRTARHRPYHVQWVLTIHLPPNMACIHFTVRFLATSGVAGIEPHTRWVTAPSQRC